MTNTDAARVIEFIVAQKERTAKAFDALIELVRKSTTETREETHETDHSQNRQS